MASMDIGGDDSVMWKITHKGPLALVREQEKGLLHKTHPSQHALNVREVEGYAEGRDPVPTDGKFFEITIKLPAAGAEKFLEEVHAATPRDGKITLYLPIEFRNYDQIHIDWPATRGTNV